MHERGLRLIAIAQMSWRAGEYHGHWAPIIRGQTNHMRGPADLWSSIASNLGRARIAPHVADGSQDFRNLVEILDEAGSAERLAKSISLSLRNLDRTVEQIAEFYNVELTSGLASQRMNGFQFATSRDQGLYALVHAFFLHLGSIRDYLAAFIAHHLELDPKRTNSMAYMVEKLRGPDPGRERSTLLALLIDKGYIAPVGDPSTKWRVAGWMEEATDLRNEFVHRRTYGQKQGERAGRLVAVDSDNGIFRYFRPLVWEGGEHDVYDVIVSHYEEMNALLFACAQTSGYDTSMLHITDKDILSDSLVNAPR